MKKTLSVSFYIFCILFAVLVAGCSLNPTGAADTDGDGIADDKDVDIDGDGLSNELEETVWGTNPILADTDGDGWDDGDEANFGEQFNPLCANLPLLQLVITSTPEIILTGENSSSETEEYTISKGSEITNTSATVTSLSETTALENSWSLEATLGYEISVGVNAGETASVSLTAGYGGSYTSEQGYSWSTEETRSNTSSVEESETYALENSITYDGGELTVGAKLVNPGNIAYTVDNLLVTGYKMNTQEGKFGTYSLLGGGNLTIDGFNALTLGGGDDSGEFILKQTFDSPDYAKNLAKLCPTMIFSISGYTSSMTVDGITSDFTGEMTRVAALCAKVIINYGKDDDPQQFMVAARTKPNPNQTSADDAYITLSLKEILKNMRMTAGTDYLIDPVNGAITSFNGVVENPASYAQWLVIVRDLDDVYHYYSASEGYDLGSIPIKPGYVVNICYSQDQDQDGLVLAMEELFGSSDNNTDSDGDTIMDQDEVLGWDLSDGTTVYTHPAIADTDGDGTDDALDDDPVSAFTYSTATISTVSVENKAGETMVFSESADVYTGDPIIDEYARISIRVDDPVRSVKIDNQLMERDPVDGTLFTYEFATLPLGTSDHQIVVTAEDLVTTGSSTLEIDSILGDLPELILTDELFNSVDQKYQMDLGFNWGTDFDSRADGAVLIYISDASAKTDYRLPDSELAPKTLKQDTNPTIYESGETAVFYWDTAGGTAELEADGGSFFRATRFDTQYSFRLVTIGQKEDGTFTYSKGKTYKSFTTPFPDNIAIDDIFIVYDWDSIEGDESDPEFIINTNLVTASGNYVDDITTRTASNPWKPLATGNLEDHNYINRIYAIPDDERDASLFGITYDIDEDDPLGEHDFVDKARYFQFMETSNDGLYGINDGNQYTSSWLVEEEMYHDDDKGEITLFFTIEYHTLDTE